jgi:DNA-binding SARP family transcriptional activator/tetratricopeptide (TPR) repeat protein
MEFRLLGPVEAWDQGRDVKLGGPRPRALLATLLLDSGQVVPVGRLIDAIWDDDPPGSASGLVQTYVSMLRRALGQPDLIRTRPPGYSVPLDSSTVDSRVFQELAASGRQAHAAKSWSEAGSLFREALALWRGPALGGVGGRLLTGEADRLEEMRLGVLEERIAVDLALRRYEETIPELTALISQHPTREALRRFLMVMLYLADRRVDALAVYRDTRRALIDELGVEPGPALRAVHEAILRDDPTVLGLPPAAPTVTAQPSRTATPGQLPPAPSDFTGRAEQIRSAVGHLSPPTPPTAVPTCVISGKGGAGKSALAARVAHELAPEYPDGQLYVALHGMTDTPALAESILARFLAALGDPPSALPATVEERTDRYRSLVAGRRILVVLDDAASEGQVRPLLPGSPTCGVLVTARNRLAGLAGTHPVEVDVLSPDEAVELLAKVAGPERIRAEARAAVQLVEHCGRLPLAVRVVGARLASRRHWSVAQFTARLRDERGRLDQLVAGDQEVRASIALSYRALPAEAQRAVRRLGALGLPNFPVWVVASLLDSAETTADTVIEQLLDARFVDFLTVDRAGQARYQMHDLLRIYAEERALVEESPQDRLDAVRRVMYGWLRLIGRVVAEHPAGGVPVHLAVIPEGGRPPGVVDRAVADPRSWFDAEQHALVASVERAAAADLSDVAADLACVLGGALFINTNMFDAWARTHEAALTASRRAGDRLGQAALLAGLGQLRCEQDRYAEGRQYLVQALGLFRETGHVPGEASTLAALGGACREQGYLPESLHFLEQADEVFRRLGDTAAAGHTSRLAGSVHLELGHFAETEAHLDRALTAFRECGSRRGVALTLRSIGLLHRARDDYDGAYRFSVRAQAMFRELADELMEAYSARAAAKALVRLGRCAEAVEPLTTALRTCREWGDRWGEALTLRTLGELRLAEGRLTEAGELLHASLRLWDSLELPLARARTLRDLARLRSAGDDPSGAAALLTEARQIFKLYGAREFSELNP